jgi:hypothetical protein
MSGCGRNETWRDGSDAVTSMWFDHALSAGWAGRSTTRLTMARILHYGNWTSMTSMDTPTGVAAPLGHAPSRFIVAVTMDSLVRRRAKGVSV